MSRILLLSCTACFAPTYQRSIFSCQLSKSCFVRFPIREREKKRGKGRGVKERRERDREREGEGEREREREDEWLREWERNKILRVVEREREEKSDEKRYRWTLIEMISYTVIALLTVIKVSCAHCPNSLGLNGSTFLSFRRIDAPLKMKIDHNNRLPNCFIYP